MSTSVNNLTMLINRQDSSGVNIENRSIGAISFSGTAGNFDVFQAPDTSIHTLAQPTPIVLQFYFKNTHATANITLTLTPQGASGVVTAVLPPGAATMYWAPVTSATAGFTLMKYTSDTAGSTFEMFLGG